MRTVNLLFSAVQFLFAILVILIGGFFVGLQYASHVRFWVARFFSAASVPFSLIGYLILGCGILLLVGFCAMYKGVFYRIKMNGRGEVYIDPGIIKNYLIDYWKNVFPDHQLSVELSLSKGQRLELYLELPPLSEKEQLKLLSKLEPELSLLLEKKLGYKKDFIVSTFSK